MKQHNQSPKSKPWPKTITDLILNYLATVILNRIMVSLKNTIFFKEKIAFLDQKMTRRKDKNQIWVRLVKFKLKCITICLNRCLSKLPISNKNCRKLSMDKLGASDKMVEKYRSPPIKVSRKAFIFNWEVGLSCLMEIVVIVVGFNFHKRLRNIIMSTKITPPLRRLIQI